MVNLSDGRLPDLIFELEIFSLFSGGIGKLTVGPESRIADRLVNHSQLYLLNGKFLPNKLKIS